MGLESLWKMMTRTFPKEKNGLGKTQNCSIRISYRFLPSRFCLIVKHRSISSQNS